MVLYDQWKEVSSEFYTTENELFFFTKKNRFNDDDQIRGSIEFVRCLATFSVEDANNM